MDCQENKRIYSNRFTATVSPTDAVIQFRWIVPEYDGNANVTGDKVIDTINVSMSRENFFDLRKVINELYEKVMSDESK